MVLGRPLGTVTLIHTNSTCSFNKMYMKQKSYYLLERIKSNLILESCRYEMTCPQLPVIVVGEYRGNTAGITCLLALAVACKVSRAALEH